MRRFPIGTRDANRRKSIWQSPVKRGRSDLVAGDRAESAEVAWECLDLEIDAGDQYCNGEPTHEGFSAHEMRSVG